jgi:hypothetical protein
MLISNIYLSGKGIALGKRNNKKFISSRVNGINKNLIPSGRKVQEKCDRLGSGQRCGASI